MVRIDRIVVGVDGSDCSVAALRGAADEGRLRGALIEALHVWRLPGVPEPGLSPPYPDDEFEAYESQLLDHAITAVGETGESLERRVVKGHDGPPAKGARAKAPPFMTSETQEDIEAFLTDVDAIIRDASLVLVDTTRLER